MARLTQSQKNEIADTLHAQSIELLKQISEHVHGAEDQQGLDLGARLNDEGDLSVADLILDLNLENLDRETEQLHAIRDAELRLRRGTYGRCIDCEADIQPARLKAQPAASRCLQCQQLYERTHATRAQGHY